MLPPDVSTGFDRCRLDDRERARSWLGSRHLSFLSIPVEKSYLNHLLMSNDSAGRIVSQTNTLTALTNMGQLGSLMENMTATLGASAVRGFYGWMLSVLDADMARRVMDAAGVGAGAGKAVS
jgi:hypothetical protein